MSASALLPETFYCIGAHVMSHLQYVVVELILVLVVMVTVVEVLAAERQGGQHGGSLLKWN